MIRFIRQVLNTEFIQEDELDLSRALEGVRTVLVSYPRLVQAIELRCAGLKYRACGKAMGITGCRVRQLEAKAARLLKHPAHFREFKRFIPGWQNCHRHKPTWVWTKIK